MTVSPDARTPSAAVHALSGSTPPGAVRPAQPFGVATASATVAEMPDTVAPLGTLAAAVVADLAARRAAAAHPDAPVIDLAGRVEALAARELRVVLRTCRIEDAVLDAMRSDPRPELSEPKLRFSSHRATEPDGARVTLIREPAGWETESKTLREAHDAALAARQQREEREEARRGLPRWMKLRERAICRLERWGLQLAAMKPVTQAGLAAKASASVAVAEGDELPDGWRQALAISLGRDAVRLATAKQPCPKLAHLVGDWRAADKVACEADDLRENIVETLVLPEPPDALRFSSATDASYIGGYQNCYAPFGYTDSKQIARLRKGVAPVHQPRADEIVAAFDAWMAACDAARDAAGLPEAETAWTRTRDAEVALRRRIVATPARCAEDLRLKAEVAVWCFGTVADVEAEVAQAARDGHCGDAETATAVLLDLVRLLDTDAMPAAVVPASNLHPATLASRTFPAGRYPTGMTLEVIESYRTFLDMELRFLNWETHRSPSAVAGLWIDNPAGSFHGGDVPPPSTRAATVLGLLGLMPTETFGGQPLAARDAA